MLTLALSVPFFLNDQRNAKKKIPFKKCNPFSPRFLESYNSLVANYTRGES